MASLVFIIKTLPPRCSPSPPPAADHRTPPKRMSSSLSLSIIPGITETSSVSEMINVLRSCFQKEVFDEVERILISQQTSKQEKNELLQQEKNELMRQKNELLQSYLFISKEKYESMRQKNELLQRNLSLSKELKECRELVAQLRGTGEMVSREHAKLNEQLQSVSADLEKMKAEKEKVRDVIIQNILSQLIVSEEDLATDQDDSATGQAITPSFDLNMLPQGDS